MKKIKFLIAIIFLGSLTWYLFIKPNDYIVQFKLQTSPGTLYSSVKEWNFTSNKKGLLTYKINEQIPYTSIRQNLKIDSLNLNLIWEFKSINDSVTKVVVGITEKENSFYNRISVPFFNTKFKKSTTNAIKGFKEGIQSQLQYKFKVTFVGVDTIPEIPYAYVELKNIKMRNKAQQMMQNNATLLLFINQHKLKGGIHPFLLVNKWDLKKETVDFRFCFPIKIKDSMPTHKDFKFDILKPRKALKAIYNGNYITSDRAWFTLHEYAKRHNITIDNKPLEIFYNNPFNGGNELEWKAEVFIPLQTEK